MVKRSRRSVPADDRCPKPIVRRGAAWARFRPALRRQSDGAPEVTSPNETIVSSRRAPPRQNIGHLVSDRLRPRFGELLRRVEHVPRLPLSFLHLEDEDQREALEMRGHFTTMTRAGTKVWPARQVSLLTTYEEDDSQIIEIGSTSRSLRRVATGWHRLLYRREYELEPIQVDDLLEAVPSRLRNSVANRLDGGALTMKGEDAVIEAVAKLRPDAAGTLTRLLGQETGSRPRLRDAGLQSAAQEADAVRLAVDIFGLPRGELREARPDGLSSFVDVLSDLRTQEDPAIIYDSMRYLDFDRIEHPSGVVVFSKGDERLTVINVNRQPLERTTGADLIYVNETTNSFVLVQYKTFRREGEHSSHLVYRPDAPFEAELRRMRRIKAGPKVASDVGFRLHPGCCFLKICKPVTSLGHDPRELVSGMYLPVEYYDLLAESDIVKGPRGGIALTYETVPRYLSNALFVLLVRGGWIGSRGASTRRLTKIVLAGLADSHSVTVAAASSASSVAG